MEKILIVEDDKDMSQLLHKVLKDSGYSVQVAFTGIESLQLLHANPYDMVLLDIMLPYKSGDKVLRELCSFSNVPVIVITGKDLTELKVDLLRLGADDYITKPFDIDEVIARIEARLRRYNSVGRTTKSLLYRDIVMDCESRQVTVAGRSVILTKTEYSILELFMRNPAKIFSKDNLFESVNGQKYPSDSNTVIVHISHLRQKLHESGQFKDYIETIQSIGYRLKKS